VTLDEILATLLKQFVRQQFSIPQYLAALCKKKARLTTNDLRTSLNSALSTLPKAFLVIDALDELPNNPRRIFLSEIRALQKYHDLRIFTTSRDDPEIATLFEGCSELRVRASTEDVKRFLSGRIETLPGFVQRNTYLQEEIITEISKVIDGMCVTVAFSPCY
jgi:hypothetical protein